MNLVLILKGQKLKREIRNWDIAVESIYQYCKWPGHLSKDDVIPIIEQNLKVTNYGFRYEGDPILHFNHSGCQDQKLKRQIRDWDTIVESIYRHCEWPDDLSKDEIIADIEEDMKVTNYGFCYEGDHILRFDHAGYLLS